VNDLIIEPGRAEANYWRDLWRYRELFYFLAWRDILVVYKQTIIGIAWAIIRPLLMMVVLTVTFNKIASLEAPESIPYGLLVLAAMLPWQFFATAFGESGNSVLGNANLISKVYFPRMIVPAASVITAFVDFIIALGLMIAVMVWYQFLPGWEIVFLPLFIVLASGAALGAGLLVSALNVEYRDFRYVLPFIVQIGMYVSPVGFSSQMVPENWRLLYACNPMVGVIDGFRWSILRGAVALDWTALALSTVVTIVLLAAGIWYFRRTEKTFADVI
jgi:lipopolysaccharide transport system permease protein